MSYTAIKPVKFDREYAIGEEIPESVVDVKMAEALVKMGLISGAIPVISTPNVQWTANGCPMDMEWTAQDRLGKDRIGEDNSTSDEVTDEIIYDQAHLSKMKKDELVALAEKMLNQPIVSENETKNSLIELIVAAHEMAII